MEQPLPSAANALDSQGTDAHDRAIEEFIEHMGLLAEEDRLPRIAGRIWGLMLVSEGALHFEQIAERLQVSRGSVSTNIRRLADLHVLERVSKPGDRRDYWQITAQPVVDPLKRVVERYDRRAAVLFEMGREFEASSPRIAKRLGERAALDQAVADGLRQEVARIEGRSRH